MSTSLTRSTEEPPSSYTQSSRHTAPYSASDAGGLWGRIKQLFSWRDRTSLEDGMADLLEEHDPEGTQLGSEERTILNNVLGLKNLRVEDVMIPRSDIIAVEDTVGLTELRNIMLKEGHTRMPVYHEALDHVIGFIHIKDLLGLVGSRKKFDLADIIRTILVVPGAMKVRDLLVRMRAKRIHMAIVVDEYGATDGLVTLEDLIEEIVGEIEDEHDTDHAVMLRELGPDRFEVNARLPVKELEERLQLSLRLENEPEEYDTLGGLVFLMLDRVPEQGESVTHPSGYVFEVIEADPRRIKRLLVHKAS